MAKNTKRTTVGNNLVALRKKSPYNQEQIAGMIGVTRNAYAKYETSIVPPLDKLILLCEIFNVSIDEIAAEPGSYTPQDQPKKKILFKASSPYLNSIDGKEDVTITLSSDEVELLLKYRSCTTEKKEEILNMFDDPIDI